MTASVVWINICTFLNEDIDLSEYRSYRGQVYPEAYRCAREGFLEVLRYIALNRNKISSPRVDLLSTRLLNDIQESICLFVRFVQARLHTITDARDCLRKK